MSSINPKKFTRCKSHSDQDDYDGVMTARRYLTPNDSPLKGITFCEGSNLFTQIQLDNLQLLDLGRSAISLIPKELGEIKLHTLILASNNLGSRETDWNWLKGPPLRSSLVCLNLSANKLKSFPFDLVRFSALLGLDLRFNRIKYIPFAIRRMKQLRSLHLAHNQIQAVPQNFSRINHLHLHNFDLRENPLRQIDIHSPYVHTKPKVPRLLALAGRAISIHHIPYSRLTLPETLYDLLEEVPLCPCGVPCFAATRVYESLIKLTTFGKCACCAPNGNLLVADAVYCSERCFYPSAAQTNYEVDLVMQEIFVNEFQRLFPQQAALC